jgi:hypothetical protein
VKDSRDGDNHLPAEPGKQRIQRDIVALPEEMLAGYLRPEIFRNTKTSAPNIQ